MTSPTATASPGTEKKSASKKKPNKKWVWAKRILTAVFFILVPVLLYTLMKNIEWQEVKQALQAYELKTLLLGVAIALTSYGVFSCYDLIGRKYTGHSLPARQVLPLAFVCYAFNLNLTAWVGGIALRFRLYSRLGLDTATITKIFSLNLITNWLGYIIVAGTIFSSRLLDLPDNWKIGATALQGIGFALLAVAIGYLVACRFAKRRSFHVFKQEVTLPAFNIAITQAAIAALNWSLMGLLVYVLLLGKISYPTVLGILLISSIAGVITHIPAGLGVLETVFITMLQHQLAKGTILAALIGYRVMYFLLPLLIAVVVYLILESRAKKMRAQNDAQQ